MVVLDSTTIIAICMLLIVVAVFLNDIATGILKLVKSIVLVVVVVLMIYVLILS